MSRLVVVVALSLAPRFFQSNDSLSLEDRFDGVRSWLARRCKFLFLSTTRSLTFRMKEPSGFSILRSSSEMKGGHSTQHWMGFRHKSLSCCMDKAAMPISNRLNCLGRSGIGRVEIGKFLATKRKSPMRVGLEIFKQRFEVDLDFGTEFANCPRRKEHTAEEYWAEPPPAPEEYLPLPRSQVNKIGSASRRV